MGSCLCTGVSAGCSVMTGGERWGGGREAQEGTNWSGKLLADSRLVSQAITNLNEILTLSQAIMDRSRNISEHLLHYS